MTAPEYKDEWPLDVKAGQTLILDLKARPKGDSTLGAGLLAQSGSLEVKFVDADGNPIQAGSVYVIGADGKSVGVSVGADGVGSVTDLPPGSYTLSFEQTLAASAWPMLLSQRVYFATKSAVVPADAAHVVSEVAALVAELPKGLIYKVLIKGYTEATETAEFAARKLSLDRALAVKQILTEIPTFRSLSNVQVIADGRGQLGEDGDASRHVEFEIDK